MRDSLTIYNRDDFRQRYKGSFGFLPTERGRTLVYIKEVAVDKVSFITDKGGPTYYANAGAAVEFEFIPVTRSWYDLGDGAALLFRVPARQYCRGINSSNTECYLPGEFGDLSPVNLSLEILNKVLSYPDPSLADYINGVKTYYVLGRSFCIAGGTLYFFRQPIGTVVGTAITLENVLVRQELMDTIRRKSLPFTLEVDHAVA